MTPSQFYAKYINVWTQESEKLGPQCVWAFKLFCKENSIPVKPTPNNWADGYWYSKDKLGYDKYFDYITDYKQFREGDWVIWPRQAGNSHPSSHIAMYLYETTGNTAMEFSLNQGGDGRFTAKGTVFFDALGALRWKGYSHMELPKGYYRQAWNGIQIDSVRASADKGYSLHLMSAEDGQPATSMAIKDLMEFDSDKLGIVAAVNANYFQMNNGMHLGCEGDGTGGYYQAPKTAGIISYYITKDGKIGAHDQSTFWLGQEDVQMVCAPYAVLIHQGQNVNLHSSAFGSKDLVKNTQTAAMRINGDWTLAIFSECYPSDVHAFAQEQKADELILMDSGGSTQMFECSTTGKRKSVRHTARLIPNVLVLAKELTETTPNVPDEPQPMPEPEPTPEEPVQTPDPDENGGGTLLPDKVYDVLKWICLIALPALAAFVLFMGEDLTVHYELVAKWINGIMMLLGSLIGVSTVQYNKVKND